MTEDSNPPPAAPVSPSPILPPPATPPVSTWPVGPATQDERTMALLAHLLPFVAGFWGPLIIWLIKKDQSAFVADQAKEALNFQITAFIIGIGLLFFMIIPLINCLVLPVILLFGIGVIVLHIIAAIKANDGVAYRYPVCIRFIK